MSHSCTYPQVLTDLFRHFVALTHYLARAQIGEMRTSLAYGMSEKNVNKFDMKLFIHRFTH